MQLVDEFPVDFEQVPSNKDNFEDIFSRLKIIEQALVLRPAAATKGFLAKRWEWIINHKGTSIILAIFLCLVGVFGGGYFKYYLDHKDDYFNGAVDKRIKSELEKPDGVLPTLRSVQETVKKTETQIDDLKPFIHDVVTHQFENAAGLPTSTLQQRLPAVQHLLAIARDQHIQPKPSALEVLGKKLSTLDNTAPSFWPTAGQLINYRSEILVPDIQELMRSDLPNCVDKPPIPMKITMDAKAEMARKEDVEANKGTQFTPALYENCRFTLDSPPEVASIPELAQGRSYKLTFRRCQIVYHGGPIRIFVPRPKPTSITGYGPTRSDVFVILGQTITFEQCLFLFDIKAQPPLEGQSLTQQLLTQSGPTLTVKFGAKPS